MIKSKQYPGLSYSPDTVQTFRVLSAQARLQYVREKFRGTRFNKSGNIKLIYEELTQIAQAM